MFLIIIAIPLQLLLDIDMLYFKGVVRYGNGIAMVLQCFLILIAMVLILKSILDLFSNSQNGFLFLFLALYVPINRHLLSVIYWSFSDVI